MLPFPPDFSVSTARLALLSASQCSLSAGELFSGCAGASVVGRVHPRFIAVFVAVHPASSPLCPAVTSHHIAIAVATIVAITIITITTIATVATTTRMPRSDRCSLQDGAIVDRDAMWYHAEGVCPAVVPAPAMSAPYTHASSPSHTVTTSPHQCNLSHRCHHHYHHRHCHYGHQYQGAVQRRMQPTMCNCDLPA